MKKWKDEYMRLIDEDEVVKFYKNMGEEFMELSVNLNNIDTVKNVHLGGKTAMTKYSDIEIQTAKNLLKEGYKWIVRETDTFGNIVCAFREKPSKGPNWWHGNGKIVFTNAVPVFQSVRFGDKEPTSLEAIVHPTILDDTEKRYLKGVIRPFRDRVEYISKEEIFDGPFDGPAEFIHVELSDGDIADFPCFKGNTMYKGMKLCHGYSLEELGL